NLTRELSGKASQAQLRNATQEFEALFLSYMLKVMRSTVESEKEESSSLGKHVYIEMFDSEIALNIAKQRGLGIGEMMYRQLTAESASDRKGESNSLSNRIEQGVPHLSTTSCPSTKSSPLKETASRDPDEPFIVPLEGELTSPYGL